MGRKRKKYGDERKPITVSLPRSLIMDLDRTLDESHTRSRLFERLLKKHLAVNTKLTDFQKHEYSCLDCGRRWAQKRHEDVRFVYCIGNNGCNSSNIEYVGVWGEEE